VGSGVLGESQNGNGVSGVSDSATGVHGEGGSFGVDGFSTIGVGVHGESAQFHGVAGAGHGSDKNGGAGILGANDSGGVGVFGSSPAGIAILGAGPIAGRFEGDVEVTGKITTNGSITASDIFLVNAGDCAEDFDAGGSDPIEPGTVMVIDQEGAVQQSLEAYDKRVAGVISGAGDLRPGIILDKQQSSGKRVPIALLGKVYCKVDAKYSPIDVGDLLTTSPTAGHAMKAIESSKAFGSVIGKALRPMKAGKGLIPILIALQ